MSAGPPPATPSPFPDNPVVDLDAAVEQLRILVDLARLQTNLTQATNQILAEIALSDSSRSPLPSAPDLFPTPPPKSDEDSKGGFAPPPSPAPPPKPDLDPLTRLLAAMLGRLAPTPTPRPNPGSSARRGFFGQARPAVKPSAGLATYAGRSAQRGIAQGRPGRWGRSTRGFMQGLGRTLGLSAKNRGRMGAVGGAVGGVAGAAVSIVEGFVKARNAVDKWTEGAMETVKKLAAVSGSMAVVASQREVADIFRAQEYGEATAGSAGRLQQAEAGRKDEENKLAVVFDNAKNELLTIANNIFTPLLKAVNTGVEGVIELVANIPLVGGDIARRLRGEGAAGVVGDMRDIGERARREAERREAAAAGMRAGARAAVPGGGAAPAGAAPLGRTP